MRPCGTQAVGAGLLGGADEAGGVDEAGERASRRSTSMMPEPQMPVTAVPAGRRGRRTRASVPMTRKRGSLVTGSISTRSMAPGAARWPEEICAPSKAGPVGEEQARTRSRLPSRISALVPTSTTSISSSERLRALGEGDGGGVGADVAGDAGQDVDAGVLVQAELDLLGPEVERVGGGEREGGLAELGRVDAEDEVVHDRVADDHRLEDQLAGRCRPRRRPGRRGR